MAEHWHTLKAVTEGLEVQKAPLIFAAIQISLILLVAASLWFSAEKIAVKIFPALEADLNETPPSNVNWVRVVLGLMGIWLILNSFPQLVSGTIILLMKGSFSEDHYRALVLRGTMTELLQFVAGCLLLIWRRVFDFFRSLLFFETPDSVSPMRIPVSSTRCPFCKEAIEGQERWVCRQCGSQHHQACWVENDGCAVFGCSS